MRILWGPRSFLPRPVRVASRVHYLSKRVAGGGSARAMPADEHLEEPGGPASPLSRLVAVVIDIVLIPFSLFIGFVIWWLLVLGRGQTPGKQIVGIRAVGGDGEPAPWVIMLLRDPVKIALHGIFLGLLADGILLILDEGEHRSAIDRLFETRVIRAN